MKLASVVVSVITLLTLSGLTGCTSEADAIDKARNGSETSSGGTGLFGSGGGGGGGDVKSCLDECFKDRESRDRSCAAIDDPIERQECLRRSREKWIDCTNACRADGKRAAH